MKRGAVKNRWIILLMILSAIISGTAFVDRRTVDFTAKQSLSEYGFFKTPLAGLQPNEGIYPYELNSALFSNYAEKLRFISMPEGSTGNYNPDSVFSLPIGTILIKNFYFPKDFRDESKGRRIMETRLLVHEPNGWNALPYIWNDEQTEAYYDVAGDSKTVQYINEKGKKISTTYFIPNKNQCKGCHAVGTTLLPIGPAARHLNKMVQVNGVPTNQLEYWVKKGLISGLPAGPQPANSDWTNSASGDLNQRARSYLDINCGHCHSAHGAANTSGLFLDIHTPVSTALGILKTPVAAGRGAGNLAYDILPAHADKSILVYRMNTTDPGIAMPEIGREQLHAEGIALIRAWINAMPANP